METSGWPSWSCRALLKERVAASLRARGVAISIVAKDIGYELRCAPPGGFDIHYCRGLGYWATRFLIGGGTDAMVTMQGDTFVPVPFRELIDAKTGRFRVRHVDVESEAYQMLAAYMIRLTRADFEDPEQVSALAHAGALDETTAGQAVRRPRDAGPPEHVTAAPRA